MAVISDPNFLKNLSDLAAARQDSVPAQIQSNLSRMTAQSRGARRLSDELYGHGVHHTAAERLIAESRRLDEVMHRYVGQSRRLDEEMRRYQLAASHLETRISSYEGQNALLMARAKAEIAAGFANAAERSLAAASAAQYLGSIQGAEAAAALQSRISEAVLGVSRQFDPASQVLRGLAMPDIQQYVGRDASQEMWSFASRFTTFAQSDEAARVLALGTYANQIRMPDWFAEDRFRTIATGMASSWVDQTNVTRSIEAFHDFMKLGHVVGSDRAFHPEYTGFLREQLGDWRDSGNVSESIQADVFARHQLYVERGFNDDLTEAPDDAVQEQLEKSELTLNWVSIFSFESIFEVDSGERAFRRRERALLHVSRFETYCRLVIDKLLTDAKGNAWPRHCLPNGMYDEWLAKREAAIRRGEAAEPIINYADFTDLQRIICKKDLFNEIFSRFLVRLESARESFARLEPIRVAVCHGRAISHLDEITLFAETKRFVYATIRVLQ